MIHASHETINLERNHNAWRFKGMSHSGLRESLDHGWDCHQKKNSRLTLWILKDIVVCLKSLWWLCNKRIFADFSCRVAPLTAVLITFVSLSSPGPHLCVYICVCMYLYVQVERQCSFTAQNGHLWWPRKDNRHTHKKMHKEFRSFVIPPHPHPPSPT